MSKKLVLSDELSLPVDAVTQTIGILAKRRAGKSYTARRLVEQFVHAGQQVAIADPKGDWWGIRSSADGKSPGLSIVILGGERGDVPLEVGGGEVVAKLVAEERVSVLLDLSLFRKHEVATFMTAFLENLYRIKAREAYRTPLMLVLDEADAIAPQKPQKGEERMLGAAEDIVRRGGQRGIGCTLITQRSAVLNKNVLTQAQMMVALRTIAPQDLAAMDAWIDVHGTDEERKTLMASLPSLPVGDAWFWSPGWPTVDGIFTRTHVLPIETFDSGATPKPGEKRREPRSVADVDLEALKSQMAETVQRAKDNDPKELKRTIATLQKELAAAKNVKAPAAKETRVEVPVVTDKQIKSVESIVTRLEKEGEKRIAAAELLRQSGDELRSTGQKFADALARAAAPPAHPGRAAAMALARVPAKILPPNERRQMMRRVDQDPAGDASIDKCGRAILSVLSQYPEGCNAGKLTLLSGYRYSGGFKNSLSELRTHGFIVGGNTETMIITEEGLAQGPFEPLPEGEQLVNYWLNHRTLDKCGKAILAVLINYSDGLTAEEIRTRTDPPYEYSGGFKNALSELRTAGLLVGKNTERMRASDELLMANGAV